MFKLDSLRRTLTHTSQWCRANPEKFTVFAEEGGIEIRGKTLSFAYRYKAVIFVMDYTADIDRLVVPLISWLFANQPDLLLNPEKSKAFKFKTNPNDDDSVDLLFEFPLYERVRVSLDAAGQLITEHPPEPPFPVDDEAGRWQTLFDDATGSTTDE
ncbi:phage tail protein [Edwardsiella piscicida]|uniref:phage tail protein n=1 Tax=Edwardsiella piscicida TaxID=1263550 RepID=UPI00370D158C